MYDLRLRTVIQFKELFSSFIYDNNFQVTKLYLFVINLFFTDQVYRETDLTKEYPILVEVFVDNDIVTFILCDSIDMFIGKSNLN